MVNPSMTNHLQGMNIKHILVLYQKRNWESCNRMSLVTITDSTATKPYKYAIEFTASELHLIY